MVNAKRQLGDGSTGCFVRRGIASERLAVELSNFCSGLHAAAMVGKALAVKPGSRKSVGLPRFAQKAPGSAVLRSTPLVMSHVGRALRVSCDGAHLAAPRGLAGKHSDAAPAAGEHGCHLQLWEGRNRDPTPSPGYFGGGLCQRTCTIIQRPCSFASSR